MRISAVIAAYDAEPYVEAAIDSMLSQTRPMDEIIAVDDGSTDGTLATLRQFGDRVRLVEARHQGGPAAFAMAVSLASGDLLAFNDADDLWAPTKLAIQSALLAENPDQEAVFGMVQQFVSPDYAIEPTSPMRPQSGVSKIGILVRRDAFLRVGSFDPSLRAMDFPDWYARAQLQGLRSIRHPDIVAHRRIHARNNGRIQRHAFRQEQLYVLKRLLDARRSGR